MKSRTYCFVASHYLPYLGGVERYTFNLVRELCARGNRVVILTSAMEGEKDYEQTGDITIIRLPSFQLLDGRFPVLKYDRKARALIAELQKLSIDYMVVNVRYYALSYFGVRYAKKNSIPCIVIEHGTGHPGINNVIFDSLGKCYEHFVTALLRRNDAKYFGVSEECSEWLQHFKIQSEGVLYNSIDIGQINELLAGQNGEVGERISYSKEDFIVTYTGRLIEEKGVLKLIQAVEEIRKQMPEVKLCIAGDGDLYGELKSREEEWLKVLGRLEFSDVIGLLQLSDVYCLPTDYPEGLPTSVLEAIACKVYVITTQKGGSKEVITDERYGTILKENTVDSIRAAIMDVIENRDCAEAAVENAYERLCSSFTWSRTCDRLMNAFCGEKSE